MSRIFVNTVRRSMGLLQAPLTLHVNAGRVKIEREYSKIPRPENIANFKTEDWFSDEGKKNSFSRKKRMYNPNPKTQRPPRIDTKAGKVVTIETPEGPLTYTSFLDYEEPVISFMSRLKSRRERNLRNCVMLEGKVLIKDAIKAGCVPKTVLFSRVQDILSLQLPKNVTLYRTRYRTLQLWSTLTTSSGIMGVFEKPNLESKLPASDALPLTIICNNIRNTGNLGSILRNAATVGCEKLIITKGCVDLWSPKVLRAASGAHFYVPISAGQPWEEIIPLIKPDASIYIADNITTFDGDIELNPVSNVMSSEFDGEKMNFATDDESKVEHFDDVHNDNDGDQDDCDNDINNDDEYDEIEGMPKSRMQNMELPINTKERRQREMQQVSALKAQIPVVPYHTVDFTRNHSVLVIGGETESLSLEMLCYFPHHRTVRVNIPLSNGFDSLNTSTATGILAFEIKRQILNKKNEQE